MSFRKYMFPWTAAEQFDTEAAFQDWLKTRSRAFTNLRMLCLIPAAICLLVGYVLDLRPVMLLTVVPLALVPLISIALDRIEKALDGQNKSEE